jgi:hypothetical protein
MAPTKETKPAVSREQAIELLGTMKALEREQENEKAGRVTKPRLLLAVGGADGRDYPTCRTRFSEGPEIPRSAKIWVGKTVHEEMPGDIPQALDNIFDGRTEPRWRLLTDAEAAEAVSDVMALRFLAEAENPAAGAESFLADARKKNAGARLEIENLKRQLAEKESALSAGLQAEASAEEFAATKARERDAWAERAGRPLEALHAAVALLRQAPARQPVAEAAAFRSPLPGGTEPVRLVGGSR